MAQTETPQSVRGESFKSLNDHPGRLRAWICARGCEASCNGSNIEGWSSRRSVFGSAQ